MKKKLLLLLILFSSCTAIRQSRENRLNRPCHTYQDSRGKWHTVIYMLMVGLFLLASCKATKVDKVTGKQVYTWNQKRLHAIHGDSMYVGGKLISLK